MDSKDIFSFLDMLGISVDEAEEIIVKPLTDELKSILNLVKMKACYNNSYHYASLFGATYVLGYAAGIFPVDHAWIKYEGEYYDPTWEKHLDDGIDGKSYVKLFEFEPSHLMGAIEANRMIPPSVIDVLNYELDKLEK